MVTRRSSILIAAVIVVLGTGFLYRHEAVVPVVIAFATIGWFTFVPGIALVLLLSGSNAGRLRIVLTGQLVGLSVMPLVYSLLQTLNAWQHFGVVLSAINVALLLLLVAKRRSFAELKLFRDLSSSTASSVLMLVLVVSIIVVVKNFTQMTPNHLLVKTTEDIDVAMLMGIVVGIKNSGYCVNVHEGGALLSYHYFVYLYMALVSAYSSASTLTVFQIVFPLYLLSLLATACYFFTRKLSGNNRLALAAGIGILIVDDLFVINRVLSLLPGIADKSYVYSIQVTGNLHISPSWLCSLVLSFLVGSEVLHVERRQTSWFFMTSIVLGAGIIMGYKSPTFVCMVGGMSIASLIFLRRRPVYFLLSLFSGIAGICVLLITIGASTTSSSIGASIGYPILRSDIVRDVFLISDRIVRPSMLDVRTVLIVVGMFPVWFLCIYGIRLLWILHAIRHIGSLIRESRFVEFAALASTIIGIGISLLFITEGAPFNIYYFCSYGLFATFPMVAVAVYKFVTGSSKALAKYALIAVLLIQCLTGLQFIAKPLLTQRIDAVLSEEWFAGMTYLRENTPKDCRIVSNRFDINRIRPGRMERFYFVPAFAERVVLASGNKYYGTPNPEYAKRRVLVDSLLATTDSNVALRMARTLKADYVVIDKWANEYLKCTDSSFVALVFSNKQIDVYKIRS